METQARKALAELATQVKSDYPSLDIAEVLNRIHFITGRDFAKCVDGFKLMFAEKLITADFVTSIEKLSAYERMTSHPNFPLLDPLDPELVPQTSMQFTSDGPRDDEDDEPVDYVSILEHLNANF